jgi:uncharacterized protein YbjT (DUF2867 family)
VTRIVNLSTSAAELEPSIQMGRWHGEADRRVRDSGIAWTSLRPGLFSTDFVNYWRPDPSGNLYLPFRDGAAAYIDPQDIAEVAARVLTSDGHAGKTYVLTGAEPLTAAQVAARIAQATARSIHYIDVPPEAARDAMTKAGMPAPIVDGMTEMFAALAAGRLAGTTGTVRELLGRAPRPFAYSA